FMSWYPLSLNVCPKTLSFGQASWQAEQGSPYFRANAGMATALFTDPRKAIASNTKAAKLRGRRPGGGRRPGADREPAVLDHLRAVLAGCRGTGARRLRGGTGGVRRGGHPRSRGWLQPAHRAPRHDAGPARARRGRPPGRAPL